MRKSSHATKHLHSENKEHKPSTKHTALVFLSFLAPFLVTTTLLGIAMLMHDASEGDARMAARSTSDLEVGVADLSPRGTSGGAYIPASCAIGDNHNGTLGVACNASVTAGPSQTIYVGQTAAPVSYLGNNASDCSYSGSGALAAGNFSRIGVTSGTIRPGTFNTLGTWTMTFTCYENPPYTSGTAVVTITVIPSPINGVCGATANNCTAGTSADTTDSATHYLWNCIGSSGGTSALGCSEPKPVIGTCPTPNGVGPANSCPTGSLGINNIQGNGDYHWYCDGAPNVSSNRSGLCWYVPPAASCTGPSYWGNCTYNVSGLASGNSVLAANSASGYTGSANILCTNGVTSVSGATCTPVVGPAPTVDSLTFTPSTIVSGNSSLISFTSSNATTCEGTGIWNGNLGGTSASGANSGPQTVTVTQNIRCSNIFGTSAWRSATLTVTPVVVGASCTLPWGGTITDGSTVTAYAAPSANPCVSETRTCNNGTLSGNYTIQSCTTSSAGAQCTYYASPQSAPPTGPAACASGTYSAWTGGVNPLYWFWNCVDGTETLGCGVLRGPTDCPATTVSWWSCTGTSVGTTNGAAILVSDSNSYTTAGSYVGDAYYSCAFSTLNYSSGSCQRVVCPEPKDASGPFAACTLTCANGGTPYPACPLPFLPDLTAGGVTPLTATMNVPVVLSARVYNPGNGTNAPTPTGFNNFFQLGGVTNIGVTSTPILLGGANRVLSITHTFPTAGIYSVRLCVDKSSASDLGLINEGLGENNNCGPATPIEVFNPANTAAFDAPPACIIGTNSNTCFPVVSWTSTNISSINLIKSGIPMLSLPLMITRPGGPQTYGPIFGMYYGGEIFTLSRSDGLVLATTTGTAVCGAPDTWNGSICAAPPPTGSFTTTPSCVIPVNGTSCTASVSWAATSTYTGLALTDSPSYPTGIYTSTGSGPQTYSPITIPYGGGTYYLFTTTGVPLDSVSGTATCAGGSAWNSPGGGNPPLCLPITNGAWFTSIPSCTIPLNGTSCAASVSFDSIGLGQTYHLTDFRGYPSGTYASFWGDGPRTNGIGIPYGTAVYDLRLGDNSILASVTGTATCAVGLTWNATRCVVPTPVLTTTPTSLSFGAVLLGNAGTRTFTITNTGDPTSQLTGTVTGNALFVCTLGCTYTALTPASPAHTVTITFTPTALGLVSTPILFNGAPAPTPLVATGNGTPVTISVPAAINFSGVPAITPFTRVKDISFTISNVGSTNLPNATFTGYAAPYTCVSVATCAVGGINLAVGAVNTVTLRFRPTAVITYPQQIGTLTGQPAYSITIDGRGILPVFNVKEQ